MAGCWLGWAKKERAQMKENLNDPRQRATWSVIAENFTYQTDLYGDWSLHHKIFLTKNELILVAKGSNPAEHGLHNGPRPRQMYTKVKLDIAHRISHSLQ